MAALTPNQRNLLYLQAATRVGIHKPVLAALYQVQKQPLLADGETGLGIAPVNQIALPQVSSLVNQVWYAANTLRSLTAQLMQTGWQPVDFWDGRQGRYSDRFLRRVAKGYSASPGEVEAALLEACDAEGLIQAYNFDCDLDTKLETVPADLSFLDAALQSFARQVPSHYLGLSHQRTALLEMVRLWHQVDRSDAAIATLAPTSARSRLDLDSLLLPVVAQVPSRYNGYPHQREALLRMTQLWRQLGTREGAIASLHTHSSPELDPATLDPALIALVQSIPRSYQGQGEQRHALVEGFRLWRQLENRSDALIALGLNPDIFDQPSQDDFTQAALQIDRALLSFLQYLPADYQGVDYQRHALLHLAQLWRGIATPEQTIQSLLDDLKRMESASPGSADAATPPLPAPLPPRPATWTPANLQLYASILPASHLTWADATQGGLYLPTEQTTVDAIVQMADLAQQASYRLGRPLRVVHWYVPSAGRSLELAAGRHDGGEAIVFYCDGLTGNQIYWSLAPWWQCGLGRFSNYPHLCYIDLRNQPARLEFR
jgi:hypothetical protein